MAKKADAWKEYREAAVVDMVLATMPKVCSPICKNSLAALLPLFLMYHGRICLLYW